MLTGLHRTNLTRVRNDIQLLTLEQIDTLRKDSNMGWNSISNGLNGIRIGKQTELEASKDFLDFLLAERGLKQ